jgi:hypothetical protein
MMEAKTPRRTARIRQFRVPTVTTSLVRVQSMVEAVQELTGGAGSAMFLFAAAEALHEGSPLDLDRISGKGEGVRLIQRHMDKLLSPPS